MQMALNEDAEVKRLLHAVVPNWREEEMIVKKVFGGMTNQNYAVWVEHKPYFLRIGGQSAEMLGISRSAEYLATTIAGELGLAPTVRFYVPEHSLLITDYIEGHSLLWDDFVFTEHIPHALDLLRRMHGCYPEIPSFSVFDTVKSYWDIIKDRCEQTVHQQLKSAMALGDVIKERLPDLPLGLCHNDLLASNFMVEDSTRRLWLVDWEYAGIGTPYFDLANFASNQQLSPDREVLLARLYFQTDHVQRHVAAIRLMRVMSDLRECLWGMVQSMISSLDFDFKRYALTHFERIQQVLDDPRIESELRLLRS